VIDPIFELAAAGACYRFRAGLGLCDACVQCFARALWRRAWEQRQAQERNRAR